MSRTPIVVVAVALLWAPAVSAHAESHEPPDRSVELSVSAFDAVLGPGTAPALDVADPEAQSAPPPPVDLQLRVLVENNGEDPVDQLRLVVEQFAAVDDRSSLHSAFDGNPDGPILRIFEVPIRDGGVIAPRDVAGAAVSLTPEDLAWHPDGGIHPIRISVVRGIEVIDEVVTAAVWLQEPPQLPLRTVLVWPLEAAPSRGLGGVHDEGAGRALAPGSRLDGLVGVLERVASAPAVPAVAPHLLEDLQDRAGGFVRLERVDVGIHEPRRVDVDDGRAHESRELLERIRQIAANGSFAPIATNYADVDLSGLLADGASEELREFASAATSDSVRRLHLLLGTEPDATTQLLPGPAPSAALDLMVAGRLIVRHTAVADAAVTSELAVRPLVTPAGRSLTALVADPAMSDALSRPDTSHGPVLAAQRIVADTALAYLEDADATGRTLTIAPATDWSPSPAVAQRVLRQLRDATWLELVDPTTAVALGRRSSSPVAIAPGEPKFGEDFGERLTNASRRTSAVAEALPGGVDTIDGHPLEELSDTLLRASSGWLHSGGRGAAEALVADVEAAVDAAFGEVEVSGARVTLTSDSGSIPVTLERTVGGPLDVRVEVASPGRLAWPDGRFSSPLTLDPQGRQTVTFATEALSTGTFPVTVRVTDPNGRVELARTIVPVRSTALSTPALWSTGALVAILLVAGIRRRGGKGAQLRVVATRVADEDDDQ